MSCLFENKQRMTSCNVIHHHDNLGNAADSHQVHEFCFPSPLKTHFIAKMMLWSMIEYST